MRDIAAETVAGTAVGGTGFMRPDPGRGETVESFQAVELAADRLSSVGDIQVTRKHRESQSGNRLITSIQFVRLK